MRYCDECQRLISECDKANDCNEKHARDYLKALSEWEASSEWVSEPPY